MILNVCKQHVEATKRLDLCLPKILIFALKRFKHRNSYRDKNGAFVDIPLKELDM